jgi:hypothetical protein
MMTVCKNLTMRAFAPLFVSDISKKDVILFLMLVIVSQCCAASIPDRHLKMYNIKLEIVFDKVWSNSIIQLDIRQRLQQTHIFRNRYGNMLAMHCIVCFNTGTDLQFIIMLASIGIASNKTIEQSYKSIIK